MGLTGHRAGEQRLAGAGRPGHQHPARPAGPGGMVTAGVAQVVDDLTDLGLDRGVAGHVGEPRGRALGVDDPGPGLGQAGLAQPAEARPAGVADAEVEQAADQQQRQQPDQHRQQRGGHDGGGGDLDVVSGQVTGEAVAAERDRDGSGERLAAGQAAGDLARRADGHRADRAGADVGQELGVGQRPACRGAVGQGQQREEAGRDAPPAAATAVAGPSVPGPAGQAGTCAWRAPSDGPGGARAGLTLGDGRAGGTREGGLGRPGRAAGPARPGLGLVRGCG